MAAAAASGRVVESKSIPVPTSMRNKLSTQRRLSTPAPNHAPKSVLGERNRSQTPTSSQRRASYRGKKEERPANNSSHASSPPTSTHTGSVRIITPSPPSLRRGISRQRTGTGVLRPRGSSTASTVAALKSGRRRGACGHLLFDAALVCASPPLLCVQRCE